MTKNDLGGNPFNGGSGRWATAQLKAAAAQGKPLNAAVLRTLDTLRHEEWKYFDEALVQEALIQLKGVADLQGAGLVRPVANSLGKTVFAYEKITFMDQADVSMDGLTRTNNDRQEYEMLNLPLPMTHKDFFLDLRTLTASREKGEPLDTTQVRTAGRVIAERAEDMLYNGGPTFGALPIYGYTNFPDRNTGSFGTNGNWATSNSAKTGPNILEDVLTMIESLQTARFYGPYWIYVDRAASAKLEDDYNPTFSTKTNRQRILEIDGIQKLQVVDKMPANQVVMVNASMDTAAWIQGETLQTVQWDEGGGFKINFKAFQIGVPLLRSDAQHRCGIYHMS